jgi:hypothetical protein
VEKLLALAQAALHHLAIADRPAEQREDLALPKLRTNLSRLRLPRRIERNLASERDGV